MPAPDWFSPEAKAERAACPECAKSAFGACKPHWPPATVRVVIDLRPNRYDERRDYEIVGPGITTRQETTA